MEKTAGCLGGQGEIGQHPSPWCSMSKERCLGFIVWLCNIGVQLP